MTYLPGIPTGGQTLSASQPQIQGNFTQLNTSFATNHVALTDATVANRGKHKYTVFPSLTALGIAIPATSGTEGAFYTKTVGAANRLFWRQQTNGTEIQMTGPDPLDFAVGYTFLPGNLLIQWGFASAPAGAESGDINFGRPFSSPAYTVVCNMIRNSNSTASLYLVTGSITATRFHVRNTDTGGPHDFHWIAIGQG